MSFLGRRLECRRCCKGCLCSSAKTVSSWELAELDTWDGAAIQWKQPSPPTWSRPKASWRRPLGSPLGSPLASTHTVIENAPQLLLRFLVVAPDLVHLFCAKLLEHLQDLVVHLSLVNAL